MEYFRTHTEMFRFDGGLKQPWTVMLFNLYVPSFEYKSLETKIIAAKNNASAKIRIEIEKTWSVKR